MVTFLTDGTSVVGWTDIQSIIDSLTAQINVSTIVGVVAAALAASVGIAFMWWVARKGISTIMAAFRKGRVSA